MHLLCSSSSPFARKVRVVAHEKGLSDRIEIVECSAFTNLEKVQRVNPVGKTPVLVLDDDTSLFDSCVICEYLDEIGQGARLTPVSGMPRWLAMRGQALADDMMSIAVGLTLESRRSVTGQSQLLKERSRQQLTSAIAAMEKDLECLPDILTMTHISFGAILGYLDFRHGDLAWRESHAALSSWFDTFSTRPSMLTTSHQSNAST